MSLTTKELSLLYEVLTKHISKMRIYESKYYDLSEKIIEMMHVSENKNYNKVKITETESKTREL